MGLLDHKAIIEPRKGKREKPLSKRALFVFLPEDIKELAQLLKIKDKSRDIYLSSVYEREDLNFPCLIGPMLGAPQAVMVMEKAIALGVEEILAIGWCGSLQSYVNIGDIIIPTFAYSEEGTSSHYPLILSRDKPESPSFLKVVKDSLEKDGLSVKEGSLWSTDAPYRETISKVLYYQNRGVLGVDMETSALMRLALYRGIKMASLLIVSDSLHSLRWIPGMKKKCFIDSRKRMLNIIGNLIEERLI